MDGAGNLVMATDGCGAVWRYEYDSLHRLVKQTSPLGAVERYTYDGHDALMDYTDAQGSKTCYEVDANGRVQRRTALTASAFPTPMMPMTGSHR